MPKPHDDVKKILNFILEKKGLPLRNQFEASLTLSGDLGLDSLDLAELTVRLEDRSGIDVFQNGIVKTIGELLAALESPSTP